MDNTAIDLRLWQRRGYLFAAAARSVNSTSRTRGRTAETCAPAAMLKRAADIDNYPASIAKPRGKLTHRRAALG
jgi:hypothetical protein